MFLILLSYCLIILLSYYLIILLSPAWPWNTAALIHHKTTEKFQLFGQ